MIAVYYRFLGDRVQSPSDFLAGLELLLMDRVPNKGEFVLIGDENLHEVVAVSWFPANWRHTKARVPVLVLAKEPV